MSTPEQGEALGELKRATEGALQRLTEKLESISLEKPGQKIPTKQLQELVERQHVILERVMESAAFIGEVISVRGNQKDSTSDILVSCYGRILSVKPLPGIQLGAGDMVKLAPNSSQIISVIERLNVGSICIVRRVIDDSLSEVDLNGIARVVANGRFGEQLQSDDRVVLDSSGSLIVAFMGKLNSRFQLGSKPTVRWEDICGLEDAKLQLQEMVEMAIKYPNLFKHYNLRQPKGALIYGPPGCGKTMLIEAVATSIAELHGADVLETGFINVKGPEILDMYVGNSERNVRALFTIAKKHKEKHGYPAIIAIDEAEAILGRRGSGINSDMEKTVVPAFLAEMGGIDDSSAIVLLCTNRQDVLDPAVIRDGRIDRNIRVPRPSRASVEEIFSSNLKKYPLASKLEPLVAVVAEEFYADKHKIYEITKQKEGKEEVISFKLSDLVNGAMAVGIIEKAVWQAFQRDKANNGENIQEKRTGVTKDDLIAAVVAVHYQKFGLNHRDELGEFVADFRADVIGINKIRLAQAQKN